MSRRALLALGVTAACGACGAGSSAGPSSPAVPAASPAGSVVPEGPQASSSARASGTAAPLPPLPAPVRWHPGPGELVPAAKLAAVRFVERRGTSADHRVEVIYAQYGGLLATSASVLVVSRSYTRRGEHLLQGGHTFDVRVSLVRSRWRVTAVRPSRPGPPTTRPTAAARHVLRSARITLPPAGAADVASGLVHDSVLEAMLRVARRWPIGVSVVRSGHPIHVFGTDRLSDHPRGRAFDTWRIDDRMVVRPTTPRSLIIDYMTALAAAGSYNVGGPVLLGTAPQYFSDATHHDHVHAGFVD